MKLIYLSFLTWMAVACQETQPEAATHASAANPSTVVSANASAASTESDSSEGVVGPDEAYFAGVYLDSLFSASQSNPHLTLSSSFMSLKNNGQVEAFDFAANLQPKRMDLMGRILLKLGDKDADGKLSFDEFRSIKLIPDLQGLAGSAKAHAFDKDFFEAAAGEDSLLA